MPAPITSHKVRDVTVRMRRAGSGPTLLFLHGANGLPPWLPVFDLLAKHFEVLVPEHPGFGASELPDWMDRPLDIAFVYLDLLDSIGHAEVDVVGCSFGGWIAAELATMAPHRLRTLTLVEIGRAHV